MSRDVRTCDDLADRNASQPSSMLFEERRPLLPRGVSTTSMLGTVALVDSTLIYVPHATADPRDPLNMKFWEKLLVVVLVCSFSAISLSFIGGFGGIISFYIPEYLAQGNSYASITHLMTYPTLSMGIGNLIGMPVAVALGRRSVMLMATMVLIIGAILCAVSRSLSMHMAARMLIGLAAGQSESVVPLIVQEIHFLHERTRALMVQQTVQVVISAVWMLSASPIAKSLSPAWWYGLGAMVTGAQFVCSIFFLPETKYCRKEPLDDDMPNNSSSHCTKRPELDFTHFEPRTWRSDMRIWVGTPQWDQGAEVLAQVLQLFRFPDVLWVAAMGGVTLGINISMATTYSNILTNQPYYWSDQFVSFANCGQIPIALICFPLLGHASDHISQRRAHRNRGVHEAKSRLMLFPLPVIIGLLSAFLYGCAASDPEHYHWAMFPVTLAGYFFAFVGTNIICITYLLDKHPTRAGAVLIFVCSGRGIISWLISFNVAYLIEWAGYYATFAALGLITALLSLLAMPVVALEKHPNKTS